MSGGLVVARLGFEAKRFSQRVLHLSRLWEAVISSAREDQFIVDAYFEDPSLVRHQCHLLQFALMCRKKLLREPGGSSTKVADDAIRD